jgi:hypothetical protein
VVFVSDTVRATLGSIAPSLYHFAGEWAVPRKKSAKHAAKVFIDLTHELEAFCGRMETLASSKLDLSLAYEAALIKLSVGFERLMFHVLVAAVNNDPSALSNRVGVRFPRHMTDEVCEYLITGGRYFDFRGRDGLIKLVKEHVRDSHYLLVVLKKPTYRESIEILIALRNFAAHESTQSKKAAMEALRVNRLASAGSWLKRQGRFNKLADKLRALAAELETAAPY